MATSKHTHTFANQSCLMWGLLRLAPTMFSVHHWILLSNSDPKKTVFLVTFICTQVTLRYIRTVHRESIATPRYGCSVPYSYARFI